MIHAQQTMQPPMQPAGRSERLKTKQLFSSCRAIAFSLFSARKNTALVGHQPKFPTVRPCFLPAKPSLAQAKKGRSRTRLQTAIQPTKQRSYRQIQHRQGPASKHISNTSGSCAAVKTLNQCLVLACAADSIHNDSKKTRKIHLLTASPANRTICRSSPPAKAPAP